MLRIDRTNFNLERLQTKSLAQAKILERHDLQEMIVHNPDPFFLEMGERLLLIGKEVKPSDYVNDSIDLLAIDEKGAATIIELKRAEQKLQLLQALSYAAMLAEWEVSDFLNQRSTFAQETVQDASDAIADSLANTNIKDINTSQRVILIAEGFDFALLKTAEWLSEQYGVSIRCYRLEYAADGSSEYLSCTCVYPPLEIADYAARVKKPRTLPSEQVSSWQTVLAGLQNDNVRKFFEDSLTKRETRLSTREVFFRISGQRRFGVCARRKHAWVWQSGRFDGDEDYWRGQLSEPLKVQPINNGNSLSFVLSTGDDFSRFVAAFDSKLKTVELKQYESESDNDAEPSTDS